MEETKPLINQTNSEIQKEKTIQDKPEINEILIENNIDQFEKPEEPKAIPQEPIKEESPIKEEIPIESNSQPQMNNDQKDINLIAINNPNIDPNINTNNNISNTNLTLITNTDPGYIASQSNNEISSITPSKSKILRKKLKREYICEVETCKRVFYDKSSFRKHILTHGEKLFICNICQKKFLDNSKLRRHSLVHSGEKPYACPMCPKRFSLDFNLRTHMRIHSGEKPYACVYPGCFKRFSQSSNLSAHEKTHELVKKEGEDIIKPIFNENPIKYVFENPFSGTTTLDNIKKINEIYELMRKGIIAQMTTINLGTLQTNRNHGEIPGMPIQKRTYIKKSMKENHHIDLNNNNNNKIYENQNINTENNQRSKSNNKKLIFQINDKDYYEISSESNNDEINNNNNNKNQFLKPYKPSSSRKRIFTTYRDPNRISNYEIISIEKSNNTIIDLSGKKKKHLNDSFDFEEDDIENKVINLMEDKEEQENKVDDFYNDNNDKDLSNIDKQFL
jgi:hypothetical protein